MVYWVLQYFQYYGDTMNSLQNHTTITIDKTARVCFDLTRHYNNHAGLQSGPNERFNVC